MADLDRKFKKPSVGEGGQLLNLIEGDITNGSPDGKLELDGPLFTPVAIRLLAKSPKRVEVEFEFDSEQGSRTQKSSRFLTFLYADMNTNEKTFVKDFFNKIVDKAKNLPELADGVEQ